MGESVDVQDGLEEALVELLFDAETSGGLLVALPESEAEHACRRLADTGALAHNVVGSFEPRDGGPFVIVE